RVGDSLQFVQVRHDAPAVGSACFGQLYAAPRAPKQLDPQKVLQAGNLSAYRTLCQCQLFCRLGEALMTGRGLETNQGCGGRYLASHGEGSVCKIGSDRRSMVEPESDKMAQVSAF